MSDIALTTGGLFPSTPDFGSLVSGGLSINLTQTNIIKAPPAAPSGQTPQQASDLRGIQSLVTLDNSIVVPTSSGYTTIGNGYQIGFDPNTLQGRITPLLQPDLSSGHRDTLGSGTETYTGSDLLIMIEAAEQSSDGRRYAKQLIEATTLTVSVHREVAPVRAGGYINPKGFALGKRTIAGSLIVTEFTQDVMMRFLQSLNISDGSKDTFYTKLDQLPPFNMTLLFTNEKGYASQRKLVGVKFVTDGVVYSIQDMLVERTFSYMALDFTPLMPLKLDNAFLSVNPYDPTTRRETIPTDRMKQPNSAAGYNTGGTISEGNVG